MIWLRVQHDETVSQTYRLVHPVRHHQGGKLVARDHLLGQREPGPRFWDQGPQCANRSRSGRRQVAMRSVRACCCPPERLPIANPPFGRLRPLPRPNTIFGESCAYLVSLVPAAVLDHIRFWWYVWGKNWFVVARRRFADSAVWAAATYFLWLNRMGTRPRRTQSRAPARRKSPIKNLHSGMRRFSKLWRCRAAKSNPLIFSADSTGMPRRATAIYAIHAGSSRGS